MASHPQAKAVRSLLFKLQKICSLESVYDGGEVTTLRYANSINARKYAVGIITSVDESWLRVKVQDKMCTFYIVLGNDNHEIVADYFAPRSVHPAVNRILDEFAAQWEK